MAMWGYTYTKNQWAAAASGGTPITANKLTKIEDAIYAAHMWGKGVATSLSAAEADLTATMTRMTTAETDIDTLEGASQGHTDSIADLTSWRATTESTLTTHTSDITSLTDSLVETNTNVDANAANISGHDETLTDLATRLAAVETQLEGGISGGGGTLSNHLFINNAAFTTNGTWLVGVPMVPDPRVANFGSDVQAVSVSSKTIYQVLNDGVYSIFIALRTSSTTSSKRAFLDFYRCDSSGNSRVLLARGSGYDTNTFSLAYTTALTAGSYFCVGHLSADSLSAPAGVAGVTNGTDIGLQTSFIRLGGL